LQDLEADAHEGLHSIPVRFGVRNSLLISAAAHLVTVASLALAGGYLSQILVGRGALPHLWPSYWVGVGAVTALLAYEHAIITPKDLSRLGTAYFRINGFVSLTFMIFTLVALVF
jgi:4-hydroxybenzoate polyprenyltransferase